MEIFINEQESVMSGIINIIRHKSLYGQVLQQLSKVFISKNHDISTFAVGRKRDESFIKLYCNVDFIKELQKKAKTKKQFFDWIEGILEHEILHIVFGHLYLNFKDKTRANVAVDCVVNSYIDKNNLPENCIFAENYKLQPKQSAFYYYEKLENNEEYKKQLKQGCFGLDGLLGHLQSSHKLWDELDDISKDIISDIIKKAKDVCSNNYGSIPSDILLAIEELSKKKNLIPWNKVLRQFVANSTESNIDYTNKKISKRYGIRPGIKKEDILDLAVAIDTSSSISSEMLNVFNNEIRHIWKNGANIHVYEADAEIAHDYRYNGKQPKAAHGGGGTDLEPVLKEVEGKYDALVYFTDFYASKISRKYKIPTLWVLTENHCDKANQPCDWGRRVCLKFKNEKGY